jgi:hypothetical protein
LESIPKQKMGKAQERRSQSRILAAGFGLDIGLFWDYSGWRIGRGHHNGSGWPSESSASCGSGRQCTAPTGAWSGWIRLPPVVLTGCAPPSRAASGSVSAPAAHTGSSETGLHPGAAIGALAEDHATGTPARIPSSAPPAPHRADA